MHATHCLHPYDRLTSHEQVARLPANCIITEVCSPLLRFRLCDTWQVDGVATPSVSVLLDVVRTKKTGDTVRIRYVTLNGKVRVLNLPFKQHQPSCPRHISLLTFSQPHQANIVTLKVDTQYWRTSELSLSPSGWCRTFL